MQGSSVPLVLNPQTGYITTQFHIVFNDWFATVSASADNLPNFNDECWQRMIRDSTYQNVLDDEDEERLLVNATDYKQAQDLLSQMQRRAASVICFNTSANVPSRSSSAVNPVAGSKGANFQANSRLRPLSLRC